MAERVVFRSRVRRLLGVAIVLLSGALSAATSPPHTYVRGEVAVSEPTAGGKRQAAGATVLVLLPSLSSEQSGAAPGPVPTFRVDDDGEGAWPTLWSDQQPVAHSDLSLPLVVAWASGRGVDVDRLGLDTRREQERTYEMFMLGHTYYVAHSRFHLTRRGHAPALQVQAGAVRLPPADHGRWLVLASETEPAKARRVPASESDVRIALPLGFTGEVFAVWGGDRLPARATTPVPVVPFSGGGGGVDAASRAEEPARRAP